MQLGNAKITSVGLDCELLLRYGSGEWTERPIKCFTPSVSLSFRASDFLEIRKLQGLLI